MMVMLSSCQGKNVHRDDDSDDNSNGDLEVSEAEARTFLESDSDEHQDKRAPHRDCVLCKFNTFRCCKPSVCVKKRFRPDECMEIKG